MTRRSSILVMALLLGASAAQAANPTPMPPGNHIVNPYGIDPTTGQPRKPEFSVQLAAPGCNFVAPLGGSSDCTNKDKNNVVTGRWSYTDNDGYRLDLINLQRLTKVKTLFLQVVFKPGTHWTPAAGSAPVPAAFYNPGSFGGQAVVKLTKSAWIPADNAVEFLWTINPQPASEAVFFKNWIGIGLTGLATPFNPADVQSLSMGSHCPEPASWAMMIAGFGLVGVTMRRRSASQSVV